MHTRNRIIVGLATLFSFCTLYATQPLLPLLAEGFAVSPADAALLVTVTMVPLGIAPLAYGYILQAIPARNMLLISILLLGINQISFLLVSEFWHMLVLRSIQGLIMPAIFTSLMTYSASMAAPGKIKQAMSLYVAITIVGGCSSRLLAGFIADHYGWQWVFVTLGILLLLLAPLVRLISADAKVDFSRLDIKALRRAIGVPLFRNIYICLALIFFVFAGILNLLPFRITSAHPHLGVWGISSLYLGYLVGVPIALKSEAIGRWLGNETRSLMLGLLLVLAALTIFSQTHYALLWGMMLVMACGIFLIHATLSGIVNFHATEHKGIVNGLYVSVYYLSGALGSWLPVLVYESISWSLLLVIWGALLLIAGCMIPLIRPNFGQ